MLTVRVRRMWNHAWFRALVYVWLLLSCYLFGEFSRPFIYRDF